MTLLPATQKQQRHVDAAMEGPQQDFSRLNQHLGHLNCGSTRVNDLPNLHLPRALENVPKSSGPQNLSREGWDENRRCSIGACLNQR